MKVVAAQKGKGKQRKKVQLHHSRINSKLSKDTVMFGMQLIADQFGDGWHKCIMDLFAGQRIEALFGDGWHK